MSQALGSVSIEYKQYGVGLAFTPIVLADGRISMRVRPEVSELSNEGALKLNGFDVPALTTRRAETTVELGSGQSFMIAGLLRNANTNNIDKAPFLGDLPILGALFRSTKLPPRRNRAGDHRHAVSGASGVGPAGARRPTAIARRRMPSACSCRPVLHRPERPGGRAGRACSGPWRRGCRRRRSGVQAVNRRLIRKDATMRSKIALLLLAARTRRLRLPACRDDGILTRGMSRSQCAGRRARPDYVFDAAAPDGSLLPA